LFTAKLVADLAIGPKRGERVVISRHGRKFDAPLDGNFKLYMNHYHRYLVNKFFITMRNLLLRLLILFGWFDELQLIYEIS